MKLSHKITALTSTILLSVAVVSPANAAETQPLRKSITGPLTVATAPVSVPVTASVSFERQAMTSVAAPKQAPVIEVQTTPQTPTAVSVPVQYANTSTPVPTPAPAPAVAQTPAPAPAPAPVSSGHGGLAAAALAQLGVQQDCTRMVENALAAIGKPVGDLGPAQFLSVGAVVGGPPQAGDILVYGNSHVAIALGNGQAVHGGFNGGTTAVGPVDVGQGAPTVVRV